MGKIILHLFFLNFCNNILIQNDCHLCKLVLKKNKTIIIIFLCYHLFVVISLWFSTLTIEHHLIIAHLYGIGAQGYAYWMVLLFQRKKSENWHIISIFPFFFLFSLLNVEWKEIFLL